MNNTSDTLLLPDDYWNADGNERGELLLFQAINDVVPDEDKVALLEALTKVPELVRKESHPRKFLKACDMDSKKAAFRLAAYWKYRKSCFGYTRAFLPMTLTDGALSEQDVALYTKGYITVLQDYNAQGKKVIFVDKRFLHLYDMPTKLRCFFYTLQIASEDEKSITNGVQVLVYLKTMEVSKSGREGAAYLKEAMPIKLDTTYVFFGDTFSYMAMAKFAALMASFFGIHFAKHKTRLIVCSNLEETKNKAIQLGFIEKVLPTCMGGLYSDYHFEIFLRERLELESFRQIQANNRRQQESTIDSLSQQVHQHVNGVKQILNPPMATTTTTTTPALTRLNSKQIRQIGLDFTTTTGGGSTTCNNNSVLSQPETIMAAARLDGIYNLSQKPAALPKKNESQVLLQQQARMAQQFPNSIEGVCDLQQQIRASRSTLEDTTRNELARKPAALSPADLLRGASDATSFAVSQRSNNLQAANNPVNNIAPSLDLQFSGLQYLLSRHTPLEIQECNTDQVKPVLESLQTNAMRIQLERLSQERLTDLMKTQCSHYFPVCGATNTNKTLLGQTIAPAATATTGLSQQVDDKSCLVTSVLKNGTREDYRNNLNRSRQQHPILGVAATQQATTLNSNEKMQSVFTAASLVGTQPTLPYAINPSNRQQASYSSNKDRVWKKEHAAFAEALAVIPVQERLEYLEAVMKAPDLIDTESDPSRFLVVEENDPWAAARRFVHYWKIRRELFGPDKAFLPMTQKTALTSDDILQLSAGAIAVLPNPNNDSDVVFSDRSRNVRTAKPGCNSRARAYFYLVHTLSQNPKNLTDGVRSIGLVASPRNNEHYSFSEIKDRFRILNAMPVKVKALHLVVLPVKSREVSVMEALRSVALRITKPFFGERVKLHDAQRPEDMLTILEKHGFDKSSLPPCVGGTWKYEDFNCWRRNQAAIEEENHHQNGSSAAAIAAASCPTNISNVGESKEAKLDRKRRRNVILSRQKRERRKAENDELKQKKAKLTEENKRLKEENNRLDSLLKEAKEKVLFVEAVSTNR